MKVTRESFDDLLSELTLSLSKRIDPKSSFVISNYSKETKLLENRVDELGLNKAILTNTNDITTWYYTMTSIRDTRHPYVSGMRLTSMNSVRRVVEYMLFRSKSKSVSDTYRDFINIVTKSALNLTKRLVLMDNLHARNIMQTFTVSFKIYYTLYRSNIVPFKITNFNNWLSAFIVIFNAGIRELNDHNSNDHCVELRSLTEIMKITHSSDFAMDVNTLDKCIYRRGIKFINQDMFNKYKNFTCTIWHDYYNYYSDTRDTPN